MCLLLHVCVVCLAVVKSNVVTCSIVVLTSGTQGRAGRGEQATAKAWRAAEAAARARWGTVQAHPQRRSCLPSGRSTAPLACRTMPGSIVCECADELPLAVWLEGAGALRPLGWWSGHSVLAGNLPACCCGADFLRLPDPPKKRGKATSSLRSAAWYGRSSTSTRRWPSPTPRG